MKTLTLTDFEAEQLLRALKKRAQVLRSIPRRHGGEPEPFEKLVAVEGMIATLKQTPPEPDFECYRCMDFFPESEAETISGTFGEAELYCRNCYSFEIVDKD